MTQEVCHILLMLHQKMAEDFLHYCQLDNVSPGVIHGVSQVKLLEGGMLRVLRWRD